MPAPINGSSNSLSDAIITSAYNWFTPGPRRNLSQSEVSGGIQDQQSAVTDQEDQDDEAADRASPFDTGPPMTR